MMVRLKKSFMGYLYLEGDVNELLSILRFIKEKKGRDTDDVRDSIRILENFDVFYETARKKFKDYLAPQKNERDLILGNVVVDKIRLIKEGNTRKAIVVLDKRVDESFITKVIKELGFNLE